MDERLLRLECLKLVMPKDNPNPDCPLYISKADQLFAYVANGKPRRGRPPKSDKPHGPDASV